MNSSCPLRPVSSSFRWVVCGLLLLAMTSNYLDRQVISYLKEYFCAGYSTIEADDLKLVAFADRLVHSTDPLSAYIKANLPASTLAALESRSGAAQVPQQAKDGLLACLNAMIQEQAIYDSQRFSGATLRPETQALLASHPAGDERAHLNRLLFADAYPLEISRAGFGWSNTDFSNLTSCFTAFYAGMTIVAGWVIDKIGTKLGLAISLCAWSVFGIANAFVGRHLTLHIIVRSAFGVGEAGGFPASVKTVAEWFPKRERALATGIFNSGTNLGAILAALFVPWCMVQYGDQGVSVLGHRLAGWQLAYICTGAAGFLWLIFWFRLYDTPARQKRLSQAEFDYIHIDDEGAPQADGDAAKVAWRRLLGYRQTWSFFFGKFLTDGIWWFYLFWLPDYLKKQFGMTKHDVTLPTCIVYGVAIAGSVYGGSIPMTLIKRGMAVYRARMSAMLLIAVCPLAVLSTQYFASVDRFGSLAPWLAVAVICVGAAAHQAWSANLFTTVSDMFPTKAVGSVTGIGAMAGGLGGVLVQKLAGRLTDAFAKDPQYAYFIMFVICALSYLAAWTIMKALVPRHRPITDL